MFFFIFLHGDGLYQKNDSSPTSIFHGTDLKRYTLFQNNTPRGVLSPFFSRLFPHS
ncbi:hypothetical protein HRM2_46790 [Desulforapulum autotrophicum HRM2]|uniref:Uncharacterized protein n=1 Tax=Desulforapulum autotrophicum (strain ATCC 43914 / DSM 3382 / VKM B-1955 / HRM2) TaxID=177437 RepID=C0QH76_DESAH|nr:hypothetical protein HRM2_46790 [Desulforapulum autotrophicum HRM2]